MWPVTYRDDRDADRARIEALEAELAAAQRRIEELEGKRSLALAAIGKTSLIGTSGRARAPWYGAPLRLAVPWKYGFKSVKSIVRFSFTEKKPKTFWEGLQANEYGFWANVNPQVPHPRWSQATEEFIGYGDRRPTLLFNGYGEQVADLYKGMEKEALWM